jgi:hypothetical protein
MSLTIRSMRRTSIAGFILAAVLMITSLQSQSQTNIKSVLFLGNSYTYVNNLPTLVAALAHFAGDSLYFDMNAPGGYTLGWVPTAHVANTTSLGLIAGNRWDFVVLQEQSQIPSIPVLRDSCMFPAVQVLLDSALSSDPDTKVMFYLTWGRRFGGMQCFTPNYCSTAFADFDQMQDSVTVAIKMISDSLDEPIAPVGEAWRFVINNYGMVLHDADDSHPNLKGSYLAACVFYASIYWKPSTGNSFISGLDPDTALILQQAADSIVFGYAAFWNNGNGFPTGLHSPGKSLEPVILFDRSTGTLTVKGLTCDGAVELYDLSGRKIRTINLTAGKGNACGLPRGIYVCRVMGRVEVQPGKVYIY